MNAYGSVSKLAVMQSCQPLQEGSRLSAKREGSRMQATQLWACS